MYQSFAKIIIILQNFHVPYSPVKFTSKGHRYMSKSLKRYYKMPLIINILVNYFKKNIVLLKKHTGFEPISMKLIRTS